VRQPLAWSAGLHLLVAAAIVLAAYFAPRIPAPERQLAIEATVVTERARVKSVEPSPIPTPPPVQPSMQPPLPKPESKPELKPEPVVIATPAKASKPELQPVVKPAPPKPATTPAPASEQPDPQRIKREAELRARMAAEERAEALRANGVAAAWTNSIRSKVERAWLRPPSVTASLDCLVRVTQVPGGEVVSVQIATCNGDASARESIEAAVYRASPLPQPPDASLFERVIEFRFRPTD
jgi:outer membrane biosynthesis protein TonB